MSSQAQQGGDQFYSALQQKATAAVGSFFKSPLVSIQYPSQGDFMWNYQNGNNVFNSSTFDYLSAAVAQGDFSNSAKLSTAGSFPNAYSQVLNCMSYSLGSVNQAKLATAQTNASAQAMTIITDYQTTYGEITSSMMAAANVTTKQDYVISYILGSVWSGKGSAAPITYSQMAAARNLAALLPNMPASGNQVLTDVAIYLNMMQPVIALCDNLQNNAWVLKSLKGNTQTPTQANGGMKTVNPISGAESPYQDAYGINYPLASIMNDLKNTGRTISLGMSTSSASGGQLSVNIQGQAGFSVGSVIKFSVSGSASYDMSQVAGTSTNCTITMTWAGYSMIPAAPLAWQQATNVGWYYGDPIAQAIANTDPTQDGFRFVSAVPYNLQSLANGGNFGQINNLLIANYPTISITYQNANFTQFKQSFAQQMSGNITAFGFINLGSFSEGTYQSSYVQGSDNSTFTVTFSASQAVIGVPAMQQTAYVIAGAITTPAGSGTEVSSKKADLATA